MKSFKDEAGRTWLLALNTSAAKRVRAMCELNLLDVTAIGNASSRLLQDAVFLAEVCYAIVKPEADKIPVTQEQFDDAIGGGSIQQMRAALLAEISDFFQKDRPEVAASIKKMLLLMSQAGPVLIRKIEAMTLESVIGKEPTLNPPGGSCIDLAEK